jgi:hypothetical protein
MKWINVQHQWKCCQWKDKLMTLYVVLVKSIILKTISDTDSYCWNKNQMCDLNYKNEDGEAKTLTGC